MVFRGEYDRRSDQASLVLSAPSFFSSHCPIAVNACVIISRLAGVQDFPMVVVLPFHATGCGPIAQYNQAARSPPTPITSLLWNPPYRRGEYHYAKTR